LSVPAKRASADYSPNDHVFAMAEWLATPNVHVTGWVVNARTGRQL